MPKVDRKKIKKQNNILKEIEKYEECLDRMKDNCYAVGFLRHSGYRNAIIKDSDILNKSREFIRNLISEKIEKLENELINV